MFVMLIFSMNSTNKTCDPVKKMKIALPKSQLHFSLSEVITLISTGYMDHYFFLVSPPTTIKV
jgi:hypothetical protein